MSSEIEREYVEEEEKEKRSENAGRSVVDLEQLQLIQLCFGEHEFGVALDNEEITEDNDDNDNSEIHLKNSLQEEKEDLNEVNIAFDFDPIQFVQDKLNHGVPLESLCHDLDTYTTFLNNSILRHVNTDVHDAFVKVSGHLVGMQDELRCVHQPVLTAVKKVENALAKLSELEANVNNQILDASQVELARLFDVSFLKLLLLYDLLWEKIEGLPLCLRSLEEERQSQSQLGQSIHVVHTTTNTTNNNNNNSAVVRAAAAGSTHVQETIRDIAIILQQLKSLFNDLPQVLSQRVKERDEAAEIIREATQISQRVFAKVYLALYEEYITTSQESVTNSLCRVMEVYKTAGEVKEFCKMYRERILRPLLDSVLSWRAATQARNSLEDTIKLLHNLKEELKSNVFPFVPLLRETFDGAILPIPMIIWPTVCEALVKKMVSLYDVGIPEAFQQRYIASHELLKLMEENCTSVEELRTLLQSPDVALWKHKWNTDVYAAMRVNELNKKIEEEIKNFITFPFEQLVEKLQQKQKQKQEEGIVEGVVEENKNSEEFCIEIFTKLKEALIWLFLPSTHIFPVTPKFIRESAVITRRISQTIFEYCEAAQSTNSIQDWLNVVMSAISDFAKLTNFINNSFREQLQTVSGQTFPLSSPVIQILTHDICFHFTEALHCMIQTRIAEECTSGLQNIRSVKSAYSHMRKPFPTSPSWYVATIIDPIQRFDTAVRLILNNSARQQMILAVMEEVVSRFRVIAKETLLTAKKTEESWEKLRRRKEITTNNNNIVGRGTETEATTRTASPTFNNNNNNNNNSTRPTPETATDRDKMTLQLYLDARFLIEEVEKISLQGDEKVKLQEVSSVIALFKLLRRANWILGEDIPEPPDIDEVDA